MPPPAALTGVTVERPERGSLEVITEGSIEERQSEVGGDLTIFITAEHQGSLETCGCPQRPRGSLPRTVAYIEEAASQRPGEGRLVLNGGYWLSDAISAEGGLRSDAAVANEWLIQGLELLETDAANISWADLPGLEGREIPAWAVSANVVASEGGSAEINSAVVVDAGGIRVGITGITEPGAGFIETPGFEIVDPVETAVAVLEGLEGEVDMTVLLSYRAHDATLEIARRHPSLDVVVESGVFHSSSAPASRGETVWLKSFFQTQRLGESIFESGAEGPELVLFRAIDMDPEVPDQDSAMELMIEARAAIEQAQMELFGL